MIQKCLVRLDIKQLMVKQCEKLREYLNILKNLEFQEQQELLNKRDNQNQSSSLDFV